MKKLNANVMLLSLLWLYYPTTAQEIDFSGKWQLNHEKTQLSDLPDVVIEIRQKEDIIDYTRNVRSPSETSSCTWFFHSMGNNARIKIIGTKN